MAEWVTELQVTLQPLFTVHCGWLLVAIAHFHVLPIIASASLCAHIDLVLWLFQGRCVFIKVDPTDSGAQLCGA